VRFTPVIRQSRRGPERRSGSGVGPPETVMQAHEESTPSSSRRGVVVLQVPDALLFGEVFGI